MKRLALSIGMIVGLASSAQAAPKIWDIPFGTPASALPATDFVDPACGTNGGPAGLPIGSFARFAACPEEASGLREIWFVYDDAAETVALALRRTQTASTTTILDQPVILSFLLDRDGRVTGFRIFTDPRAEPSLRLAAHEVMTAFRARFGLGRECSDLPLAAGEAPVDGRAVKQLCRKESDGRRVDIGRAHD